MKGKRSIRTAIVLVTSILLVSVVASGVMAAPPPKGAVTINPSLQVQ